jgi:hypothetical protein
MMTLPIEIPPGFGVRQPSGALASHISRLKSGRGLPQSKTLARMLDALEPREASGLRRVHRRFVPGSTTTRRNKNAL